ncbi:hypothetical protein N7G274_007862 [Stereocaulon virgatum]|uniref:Uncharacterized protein n=1 Tax=Stereocaulon virgatum TaxID=373712 RepID=A0ABR4A142_9LECA
MGADFPAVGGSAYPENIRENAYILTEELQKLQQAKKYVGNKPMPMQSYKPMVTAMLNYLKKTLINGEDFKSMNSTLTEIQKRVQNTEQKVVTISHKLDTTKTMTPTSKGPLTWAKKLNAAATAQASTPIISTPPITPIYSLAKTREVICKLSNMNLSNELKQRSPAQLKDRVNASIMRSSSGKDKRTPQIVQARILPSGDLSVTGLKIEDTIVVTWQWYYWSFHIAGDKVVLLY